MAIFNSYVSLPEGNHDFAYVYPRFGLFNPQLSARFEHAQRGEKRKATQTFQESFYPTWEALPRHVSVAHCFMTPSVSYPTQGLNSHMIHNLVYRIPAKAWISLMIYNSLGPCTVECCPIHPSGMSVLAFSRSNFSTVSQFISSHIILNLYNIP